MWGVNLNKPEKNKHLNDKANISKSSVFVITEFLIKKKKNEKYGIVRH